MSTYQITLLLKALVTVYSSEELSAGEPVLSCLVNHLRFDAAAFWRALKRNCDALAGQEGCTGVA